MNINITAAITADLFPKVVTQNQSSSDFVEHKISHDKASLEAHNQTVKINILIYYKKGIIWWNKKGIIMLIDSEDIK